MVSRLPDITAADWNRLANPQPDSYNPFLDHAFLLALESSGCVGPRTGWQPQHLVLSDGDGTITGCAPAYLKTHSKGEYVFDYGWAEAYERAGGSYYPKLQIAVPFTPVPGRRLLTGAGPGAIDRAKLLAAGAGELARRHGLSSVHATFLTQPEWEAVSDLGYLQRTDQQFHWHNAGYTCFDDFLASLASRKRKAVRKEREAALASGLVIEHVTGSDITETHWDAFYAFYMDTGSRKWGRPYLNREFFSALGAAMADRCLLVMARRDGAYVAGALNLIGGDCLYGPYWGATEQHPCLHFEICYYQAIDYAIAHGLGRVEAGAQGEHKLARGYEAVPTYSAHYIANGGFRAAIADFLAREEQAVAREIEFLGEMAPFRRGDGAG